MKKSYYIFFALALASICSIGCDKDEEDPQYFSLAGTAYYIDILNQDSIALTQQKIDAKNLNSGTVYPVTTDTRGFFLFPGFIEGDKFQLTAKSEQNDSSRSMVVYRLDTMLTIAKTNSFVLRAILDTLHYNAVLLTIKDTANGVIRGADVWGYSSGEVAHADTSFKGIGAMFHLKSSIIGQGLAMQLPGAPLYIRSQFVADSNKIIFRNKVDTVHVNRFKQATIELVKK
jgi:hypothetical protein